MGKRGEAASAAGTSEQTTRCRAMRLIFALFAMEIISMDALAEVGLEDVVKAVPSALGEPEPLLPERCEFLGVRDGVKLWRGDCVSVPPYAQLIAPKKKKSPRQKSKRQ